MPRVRDLTSESLQVESTKPPHPHEPGTEHAEARYQPKRLSRELPSLLWRLGPQISLCGDHIGFLPWGYSAVYKGRFDHGSYELLSYSYAY